MSDLPIHNGPCPKCRHVRTAKDESPTWQCPNCGVAYNKVAVATTNAANVPRPRRHDHANDSSFTEEEAQQPKKVFPWKIAVIAVTLAAFGIYEFATFKREKTKRALEVREAQVRLAEIEQIIEEIHAEKARAKAEATRLEAERTAGERASVNQ